MKVLWAHGLEGSPNGSKPTWIIENLGWNVVSIDMSRSGWTIGDQTKVVIDKISEIDDFVSLMDNIVYGIRDYDFPYFIPHKTYPLPLSGATDFVSKSMEALENGGVPTIESLTECVDVTGENFPTSVLVLEKLVGDII